MILLVLLGLLVGGFLGGTVLGGLIGLACWRVKRFETLIAMHRTFPASWVVVGVAAVVVEILRWLFEGLTGVECAEQVALVGGLFAGLANSHRWLLRFGIARMLLVLRAGHRVIASERTRARVEVFLAAHRRAFERLFRLRHTSVEEVLRQVRPGEVGGAVGGVGG